MPHSTKLAISEAFAQLAMQKSLDKITVRDVVEQCHITRQTFYYHFRDLMAVIEWMTEEKLNGVVARCETLTTVEEVLREFIASTYRNREQLLRFSNSRRWKELEKLYVSAIRQYIQKMVEHSGREALRGIAREDMDAALNFYAYALAGSVLEAILQNDEDISQLAARLSRIISGEMFRDTGILH